MEPRFFAARAPRRYRRAASLSDERRVAALILTPATGFHVNPSERCAPTQAFRRANRGSIGQPVGNVHEECQTARSRTREVAQVLWGYTRARIADAKSLRDDYRPGYRLMTTM